MLYRMRLKGNAKTGGGVDRNSSGTWVEADGATRHLALKDYAITPLGTWKSPKSGATYPMGWRLSVPGQKVELTLKPAFPGQELVLEQRTGATYWEGACTVTGTVDGKPVKGQAYVEMTGYKAGAERKI